jgi:hypothetical protein
MKYYGAPGFTKYTYGGKTWTRIITVYEPSLASCQ